MKKFIILMLLLFLALFACGHPPYQPEHKICYACEGSFVPIGNGIVYHYVFWYSNQNPLPTCDKSTCDPTKLNFCDQIIMYTPVVVPDSFCSIPN